MKIDIETNIAEQLRRQSRIFENVLDLLSQPSPEAVSPLCAQRRIYPAVAKPSELIRGRPGRVLSVDTRAEQSARKILRSGEPLSPVDFARVPAEARAWMRHRGGLVGVAFDNGGYADWLRTIGPIVRHFDVVGTDWGPLPLTAATTAALTAQVVCVTGTYERRSAEAAIAFARALQEQHPDSRPLLVLSDITRTRSTWPRLVASRISVPLIAIPHDRALATGGEPAPRAVARIRSTAAAVIREATGSDRPW